MSGLGALALGAAPLAGGVMLGAIAGRGRPSAPDVRAIIKSELDLLERIPEDQVSRRAALEQVIAEHIDNLVVAIEIESAPYAEHQLLHRELVRPASDRRGGWPGWVGSLRLAAG